MIRPSDAPDLDDVLEAFALDAEGDETALARYVSHYPQHAVALIDLSLALTQVIDDDDSPATAEEITLADAAWARLQSAESIDAVDPFADRTSMQMRELARTLDVPRQVVTAFRERRILLTTIPRRFLEHMAAALGTGADALLAALAAPPTLVVGRSYKTDAQPMAAEQVSFEQILIDADMDSTRVADLVAGRD